jgi:large repetitive protein
MRAVWAGLAAVLLLALIPAGASAITCDPTSMGVDYATPTNVPLYCGTIPTSVDVVNQPGHGTLDVAGGLVTYTPEDGFYGATDSFDLLVHGDAPPAPVHVNANVTLPAPTCPFNNVQTSMDEQMTLALGCGPLVTAYTVTTGPSHGSASIATDGTLTYVPAPGYEGSDRIYFDTTNPDSTTNHRLDIDLRPHSAECDPVPSASVPGDRATTFTLTCRYTDSLSVQLAPRHGTAAIDGWNVTYTPTPGYSGPDRIGVDAVYASGTELQLLEFDVQPVAAAAAAGAARCDDVAVDTAAATPVTVPLGCSELTWSWSIVGAPAHGTLGAIGPLGTVTYTPDPAFHGVDRFTFRANGPGGGSATTTALVRVGGTDATPAAAVVAPPAPRCAGRVVTLRVGARARVLVGGKRVAVRHGRARVDLRGRTTPTVTVHVAQRRADGRLARSTRVISVCG